MASNYRPILGYLLRRLPIALALGLPGWWLLTTDSGGWGAVAKAFFGIACLIGACIAIAFPVARLLAESSGNLFYGGRHARRPAPMYGIPESKRAKGLYEEAMAGFEAIAKEYPNELKVYIEMIDVAIVHLRNPEQANALYRRGLAALKKAEDREALARLYQGIRTRAIPAPPAVHVSRKGNRL